MVGQIADLFLATAAQGLEVPSEVQPRFTWALRGQKLQSMALGLAVRLQYGMRHRSQSWKCETIQFLSQ